MDLPFVRPTDEGPRCRTPRVADGGGDRGGVSGSIPNEITDSLFKRKSVIHALQVGQ